MATILLAIGDSALRDACRAELEAADHAVLLVDRPLAPLTLAPKVAWDAVCADASDFGRLALTTLRSGVQPVVGVGLEGPPVNITIPLPLVAERLLDVLSVITTTLASGQSGLRLDAASRLVRSGGREVALTRTEFRLLEVLFESRPREVGLDAILQGVWGSARAAEPPS
jgi:hypothetical protein